jgi:hypothetical protein
MSAHGWLLALALLSAPLAASIPSGVVLGVQTYPDDAFESQPIRIRTSPDCSSILLRFGAPLLMGISLLIRMSNLKDAERRPDPESAPLVDLSGLGDAPHCPYCGGRIAKEKQACCECGCSTRGADDTTCNESLTREELLAKAHRLFNRGLHRQSLDLYLYIVRKEPDCREAWTCIKSMTFAGPELQAEAGKQLERIERLVPAEQA